MHDIYAEWRTVFNAYDPPRTAVAEAWVATPERRAKYASAEGLGQAFNFDLLQADFDADQFRAVIAENLAHASVAGSSTTWVLSNHDVVRHPTRYGLPPRGDRPVKQGAEWIMAGGPLDEIDLDGGLRRARAATLLVLALPGSAYLYQGEELGLGEVADIPDDAASGPGVLPISRPADARGSAVTAAACRSRGPASGPSFGFGDGGAHLPQPSWFAEHSRRGAGRPIPTRR